MVDHGKIPAHLTSLRLGTEVVERADAGVGAHRPGRADAIGHEGPLLDHPAHLLPLDREDLRVRDPRRGGAQDRDTQPRDDDVAVARLMTSIDGGVGDPV